MMSRQGKYDIYQMRNPMNVTKRFIILVFISLFCTSHAWSEDNKTARKIRVAMLNVTAVNTSQSHGDMIRDILEVALHKTERYDMLERNQMGMILNEHGLQMAGCTEEGCAVQIGKLLSTDIIIIGRIIKTDQFTITIKFVDIRDGRVVIAEKDTSDTETGIPAAVDRLALRISDLIIVNDKFVKEYIIKKESEEKKINVIIPYGYYTRGFVPGWGQMYAGNTIRGMTYMTVFLGSLAFFGYSYYQYSSVDDKYHSLGPNNTPAQYRDYHNRLKDATAMVNTSIIIMSCVYAWNWIDMLFFSKKNYYPPATTEINSTGAIRSSLFAIDVKTDRSDKYLKPICDFRFNYLF
jgi:hypothetical protein